MLLAFLCHSLSSVVSWELLYCNFRVQTRLVGCSTWLPESLLLAAAVATFLLWKFQRTGGYFVEPGLKAFVMHLSVLSKLL